MDLCSSQTRFFQSNRKFSAKIVIFSKTPAVIGVAQSGKYGNSTYLTLFWQKFCESNGFTKYVNKELISQKIFRWERFSHFYTLWVEMKRKTLSQFLRRNNFSIKSSYTSPYWHITNLRPLWDWILIGILCVLLYNLKWIDLIRKKLLGTNNFKCSINPQLFAFKLSLGIVIQIGRINQEMYYKTGSSWKI